MEGIDNWVRPRPARNQNPAWNVRIAARHFPDNIESCIIGLVSREENLVLRIILAEEAFDIFSKPGLEAMNGLEHGYGRKLPISRDFALLPARILPEVYESRQKQAHKNR